MVARFRLRLYLLGMVFVAGISALVARLWHLQIDKYDVYASRIPGSSYQKVRVPGVRGEIRDRNGILLVSNDISYEVLFNLSEIEKAYKAEQDRGLVPKAPLHEYQTYFQGRPVPRTEPDIAFMVQQRVIPGLHAMGLARDFSAEAMRVHRRTNGGAVPWPYRRDLTFSDFAKLAEHNNMAMEGLSFSIRPVRRYIYDSLASHILGYVSPPDIDKVSLEEREGWDYYVGDDFGVTGVEATMNDFLRGRPGWRTLLRNEKGVLLGEVDNQEPKGGSTIYLTLDARMQYLAEQAVREADVGRAATVVIDPRNGDILAMVSVPSFNPNKFIPSISREDYEAFVKDKTHPLINRALKDYAPGSTYKIPIALAGCLAKTSSLKLSCGGGRQYGNKFMKCWIAPGSHGTESLSDAIKDSCNGFFYDFGNRTGIANIVTMGNYLGLGQRTGVELDGEDSGILPNPQWVQLNAPGISWSTAQTALTSIGQGFVETSPLQMASMTASTASSGKCYQPRLIMKLVDADGGTLERPVKLRYDLLKEGVTAEQIENVRKGMWRVIHEAGGTGRRAAIEGVESAGKTGTAQVKISGKDDNIVWFISFAPYENPRYAIATMVQGGKAGGTVAAPISRRILQGCLALEQGFQTPIKPLPEAKGAVKFTELVTFNDDPVLLAPGETLLEDAGDVVEGSQSSDNEAVPMARPVLEPDADAAGAVPRATPVVDPPVPRAGTVPRNQ
jgi:penicillin-binding protein 2